MKLLIDECIGKGIYQAIKPFLERANPPIESIHILDFNQSQGIADEVWVPRAAKEGWIVITGDSGATGRGAPLQVIMPEHGVTAIYFSGKLQQKRSHEKAQAIIAILKDLPSIAAAAKGSRYKLTLGSKGGYRLSDWPQKKNRT